MRTYQSVVLCLLLGVLLALLTGSFVTVALGSQTMTLALTPLGWRLLNAIVAVLALVSALTLVREPRNRLVAVVLVVMLLDLLALLFRPESAAVFGIAAIALFVASVVGSRRQPAGWLIPVVVLSGVIVIVGGGLLAFNLAMSGVWGMSGQAGSVYADERSPGGSWRLIASENDPGAMGSVSSTVVVRRDLLGIFRLQRDVFRGYGSKPDVRWADARTVDVDGARIDIWRGDRIGVD